MLKLLIALCFLAAVNSTPLYKNEASKNDVDIASQNLSKNLTQAKHQWNHIAMRTKDTIYSMFNDKLSAGYKKLQGEIENGVRNITETSIQTIITTLNKTENNSELLQCIDLKKTIGKIDQEVQHALLNVYNCKWIMVYDILDDLFSTRGFSYSVSNITDLMEQQSNCVKDMTLAKHPEILGCIYEISEKVQPAVDNATSHFKNYAALLEEKLMSQIKSMDECNNHFHMSEIITVRDKELHEAEECIRENKALLLANEQSLQNNVPFEEIRKIVNNVKGHLEEKIDKITSFTELKYEEMNERVESARHDLNVADGKDTLKIIENLWQARGNENKTLRTYLTDDEYDQLLECASTYTECSSEILMRYYGIHMSMERILPEYVNTNEYNEFKRLRALGQECVGGLKDISNFNDVVSCLLRVNGESSQILLDLTSLALSGSDSMLQTYMDQLKSPVKCHPAYSSSSHLDYVKTCFADEESSKADIIFGEIKKH